LLLFCPIYGSVRFFIGVLKKTDDLSGFWVGGGRPLQRLAILVYVVAVVQSFAFETFTTKRTTGHKNSEQ
jgi:hypothetical protein